jgi:large subunit ribosomal protein L18e
MPRTFNYKDPGRAELIKQLEETAKKENSGLWQAVASKLNHSRRSRSEVNLHKINKHTQKGDTIVVPGKVLGDGTIEHQVDIAAYRFTQNAVKKIADAGGKTLKIIELAHSNPKGSNIKIIG